MRGAAAALLVSLLLLAAPASAQSPVIATVDGVGEVTLASFDHWSRISRRRSAREERVMEFLVHALWIEGEARQRGIDVTAAEVRRRFLRRKRQSFPRPGDVGRFLRESGMTVEDMLFQIRVERLSVRLRRSVRRSVPAPTEEEVRAAYEATPDDWQLPERRDVRYTTAPTRAAARRLLGHGRLHRLIPPDRLPPAVFARRRGVVRWGDTWLAFVVVRVRPPRRQGFGEVDDVVRSRLLRHLRSEARRAFAKDFEARWRAVTACDERFATDDCGRTFSAAPR